MVLSLSPGTICVARGHVVEIDGPENLVSVRVRNVATGQCSVEKIADISEIPKQGSRASADLVPEEEWARCSALAKDLLLISDIPRVSKCEMKRLSEKHGISIRSLQRSRARFSKDPRVSSLIRDAGGRPEGFVQISDKADQVIKHCIKKYYLNRQKASKQHVVDRAQSLGRRLGIERISRDAVLLRIRREEGYETDRERLGGKSAKQKWKPRTGSHSVPHPLDMVQIDHTPADVLVLSDDRSRVLGRPWATFAIDVATRCVVGFELSMNAPSSVSVALCIANAVLPKDIEETTPGLWPMCGIPEVVHVDNGKDFKALALKRGCEQFNIDLRWRPVRTPHYGAHIERLNGTMMKMLHLLPGTVFSNTRERGDYPSEKKAALTVGELREWMIYKICYHYHAKNHKGIGCPPLLAWERGIKEKYGLSGFPPLPADKEDFQIHFLPFKIRTIQRTGVHLNASVYWDDELAGLVKRGSHIVHYNPRAPQMVWLRLEDGSLVRCSAVSGRAVTTATTTPRLTEDEIKRLNEMIDRGFEESDKIVEGAVRKKREERQEAGGTNGSQRGSVSAEATDAPSPEDDGVLGPLPYEEWA